ncbi:MAG: hypothetical protein DMG49_26000 [Acidobacteria bacterium]|nr:MAG: hypothetical protein DMG49_26000 [Acidobacteriota bacterium]
MLRFVFFAGLGPGFLRWPGGVRAIVPPARHRTAAASRFAPSRSTRCHFQTQAMVRVPEKATIPSRGHGAHSASFGGIGDGKG